MYPLRLTQYNCYSMWGNDVTKPNAFWSPADVGTWWHGWCKVGRLQIRYGHFLNVGTGGDTTMAHW